MDILESKKVAGINTSEVTNKIDTAKPLLEQLNTTVEQLKELGFVIDLRITEGEFLH